MTEPEKWRDWYYEKPPRDTVVRACWSLSEQPQIVRTCKHGCCVKDEFGHSLILPNFWLPALPDKPIDGRNGT